MNIHKIPLTEMLDYYGSITKDNEEIREELLSYFKKEIPEIPEDALTEIYEELRSRDIIHSQYSVSGWMVYGGQDAILQMKTEISKRFPHSSPSPHRETPPKT